MTLWVDFETRSACDLKAAGVYNYAQDSSTDVLMMSYAFNDGEVQTWLPDQPFPAAVAQHTGLIYAHNAAFERLIFWYVLGVNFKLEQFYCTATQARANCAPGSLEDVGRFAGASMKKDHRGAQLIRLLSIPQANGSFRQDATLMAEMISYCEQDVRAMRAVSLGMRPLSEDELADYHVNERINDRGVMVDVPLCQAAIKFASDEMIEIEQIVAEVTEGAITSVRSPKMRQWVIDRVGPQASVPRLLPVAPRVVADVEVRLSGLLRSPPAARPFVVPARDDVDCPWDPDPVGQLADLFCGEVGVAHDPVPGPDPRDVVRDRERAPQLGRPLVAGQGVDAARVPAGDRPDLAEDPAPGLVAPPLRLLADRDVGRAAHGLEQPPRLAAGPSHERVEEVPGGHAHILPGRRRPSTSDRPSAWPHIHGEAA